MALLRPTTYNWQQKMGAALVLVLLLVVVTLHNPFFGYDTGYDDTSFLDWNSYGAITAYLKPLKAALGFAVAILVFGFAWVWLFEGPPKETKGVKNVESKLDAE